MKKIFITGVDTDIGKTFVSVGLCLKEASKGSRVGYFKPFQSGAFFENGILKAPDIEEFNNYPEISTKCSYLLEGEASPYCASKMSNTEFNIDKVKEDIKNFSIDKDVVVIEGAGGFYCPVSKDMLFCDVIKKLDCEIIIVTTPDLGRLNHTLMTIECAKLKKIPIKGLIINKIPDKPTLSQKNFIEELKDFTECEILGVIPVFNGVSKENIIEAFCNIKL